MNGQTALKLIFHSRFPVLLFPRSFPIPHSQFPVYQFSFPVRWGMTVFPQSWLVEPERQKASRYQTWTWPLNRPGSRIESMFFSHDSVIPLDSGRSRANPICAMRKRTVKRVNREQKTETEEPK